MIDCLIIGGGPAGLTAGIYLRRFHRSVTLVDKGNSRARRIPLAHNYPGFPDGISGIDLLARMQQQLQKHGASLMQGEVTALAVQPDAFKAEVNGKSMLARTVLLATGGSDIEPELEGYESVRDSGLIRFCPICDGFEFTDRRIGIIGRDAHGVREYDFIRNFSDKLSYISLQGEAETQQDVEGRAPAVDQSVVAGLGGKVWRDPENPQQLCFQGADGKTHYFSAIYCALGSKVHSRLAMDLGATHDGSSCLTVNEKLETSVPGLYAAGDVVSGLDQLVVATGQAAIASTAIHNRLRNAG